MNETSKVNQRLALLDGIDLSPADLEFVATEAVDIERVVAQLEEFARDVPWISLQAQPVDKKA